jgi:hypothetical protein
MMEMIKTEATRIGLIRDTIFIQQQWYLAVKLLI